MSTHTPPHHSQYNRPIRLENRKWSSVSIKSSRWHWPTLPISDMILLMQPTIITLGAAAGDNYVDGDLGIGVIIFQSQWHKKRYTIPVSIPSLWPDNKCNWVSKNCITSSWKKTATTNKSCPYVTCSYNPSQIWKMSRSNNNNTMSFLLVFLDSPDLINLCYEWILNRNNKTTPVEVCSSLVVNLMDSQS